MGDGAPVNAVDQFRRYTQAIEFELFTRIRHLEGRLIENLPPQVNLGEYEALVRGFIEDAINVDHYCSVLSNELLDITVLELKASLLDQLVNLLFNESTERLAQILEDSPFPEQSIRTEALEFINEFRIRLGLHDPRFTFGKSLLLTTLRYWIQETQLRGHLSLTYKKFLINFFGLYFYYRGRRTLINYVHNGWTPAEERR